MLDGNKPAPGQCKAGAFSAKWSLTRQALHQYVLIGVLVPCGYSKGGQAWYGPAADARMALIRTMQREGKSLAEIRDAVEGMQPIISQ